MTRPLPSPALLPRDVEIEGKRYLWRDLVALRRAQAVQKAVQPALFELVEDCRPAGERSAAERYREPSLFTLLEDCPPAVRRTASLPKNRQPALPNCWQNGNAANLTEPYPAGYARH